MKVWIDQDLCTGDGLCEEIAPDVFTLLDDGLAYVVEGDKIFAEAKGNPQGADGLAEIPDGQVLGLSKVARIVDMFARRLQIQEQLTFQIAEAIQEVTGARDVGVIIEARHLCMMMRGVEKQNSRMKSSAMLGAFQDNASTRAEFLNLLDR